MIVDLHLRGGLVIIAGAGAEGLKRTRALLDQDCKILVIGERPCRQIEAYARQKRIELRRERLGGAGFLGRYKPVMVMAATDDTDLNCTIIEKARQMGTLVYASDNPGLSDFAHLSLISIYGTIRVALSTGGQSPVMAIELKRRVERTLRQVIRKDDILQIRLHGKMRAEAKKSIPTPDGRRRFLRRMGTDAQIKQLIKEGRTKPAQRRAMALLAEWK